MLGPLFLLGSDSAEETGEWGEHRINVLLSKLTVDHPNRFLFKDIYIECDGYVYQIDHIFLCEKGIFVIETKTMNGTIFADPANEYWSIDVLSNNARTFYNPIMQNASHVKAIKNLVGDDLDVQSVVVFANKNKPVGCPSNVINRPELSNYILSYNSSNPPKEEDILFVKKALEDVKENRNELIAKHKAQLKKYKYLR